MMRSTAANHHRLNDFEFAIRFLQWAGDSIPTWQQIAKRWEVSRPTAYRWRAALKAARGVD